ncbi:MAG: tetratricopeptide repeat protein [Anaerolineales bacterium]|nr:tetratricopeptide repeat protein [Anaerolineales bacterium]
MDLNPALELRLLGGLRCVWNGAPLSSFLSNKAPALLVYLAVDRRPHPRETLAALLWGGLADADARNNLRQTLSNLRKLVGPFLTIDRDQVAFAPAGPFFLDTAAFEQHLRAAAGQPPAAQAEHWQAASALYQGDFLAGFAVREAPEFEDWLLAQRARFRELAVHALHALTQHQIAAGDNGRAVEAATRLLALDPWREEAHRQLMLLKARTGQRSAALAQYEVCRRVLERDLGVEPSRETTALYERLLAAQRGARHNLPASLTAFVGRAGELAELQRRLADPACRLVTLTGPGGVGKTRLALQAAAQQGEAFINGAWYAALAAADDATLVEYLADAVGLELKAGNPKKQLMNYLRSKEQLLVLDNFDHLVGAAGLLSELLQAAPDVKCLVTSRERLNLQSEWVFELAGLAVAADPAADPAAYSAGQLFFQTARRHQAAFQLAAQDGPAVLEICRLLEGLPLGLELAAARTQAMACPAIAAEIRRGLDFLASTQRDVPERQRSLRVVMEASWRALTPAERRAFAGLAAFPASFSAAAAEAVAEAAPATLSALVNKSLVRQSADRFELHEVLRHFAREALTAEPERAAGLAARQGTYYAGWLSEIFPEARGGTAEGPALTAIAAELPNLRAAWHWATAERRSAELGRLFPGLYRFMDVRGHYREGAEWFTQAAAALSPDLAGADEPGRLAASMTVARARFLLDLGQLELAVALFEAGRTYFQRVPEPQQLARCLNGLGTAARVMGQFERARTYCLEQLHVSRAHGLTAEAASALNNLGVVLSGLGQYPEAIRVHRECLALRRELGDQVGLASSLINLSTALVDSGDDSQTVPLLGEALQISRQFNDARRTAAVLTNLGAAAKRAGRLDEEKDYYQQALAVHRESGHRLGIALALNNLGSVTSRLGELGEARRYLHAALSEAQDGKFEFVALDALVALAQVRAQEGQLAAALELLALPLYHPGAEGETTASARALLAELTAGQDPALTAEALERGRTQPLAQVLEQLLAG